MDATTIPAFLTAETCVPTIQPHEVCKKLLAVQPFKAQGPDNVPRRILKEFAYELAEPVTTIFNHSLLLELLLLFRKIQTLRQSQRSSLQQMKVILDLYPLRPVCLRF